MLYSFHGVLHGEADVDLCTNLKKNKKKQEEMLKVFADTQYKIVTCSPAAMRPDVQFNIVVSFHTNLLRAS